MKNAADRIGRFIQQKALEAKGAAGKALTNVGTAFKAPQIIPGGLGANLQSQAGYALSQLNPVKKAEAKETLPPKRIISDEADQAKLRAWEAENAARARQTTTGGVVTPPITTTREEPRREETRQDQGESDYDASIRLAQEKQEEAERVANQRMRRYGEVITPITGDIESYLSSRPDLNKLFQEQLTTQGVPGREGTLRGFEKDVTNLQGQLETLPTEDINRRKETGMITAAAERRIRSMEERPIREQLLKTQGAVSSERVGLQRAYDVVDKMLDITREQEKRGLEPLETRLEAARGEFTNEVDALAQRLTGFNQARTDQLSVLKQKIANDQALSLQEQKATDDLIKQEAAHVNEMEQIAARRKGTTINSLETDQNYEALKAKIQEGATSKELQADFQDLFDVATWEKILELNNNALSLNDKGERQL